jgi:hypothetical protein
MSQSDYIGIKKTQQLLRLNSDLPHVLGQQDYIMFKQYNTEVTVQPNIITKPSYNQLNPIGQNLIFNMVINTKCPMIGNYFCRNHTATYPRRQLNCNYGNSISKSISI